MQIIQSPLDVILSVRSPLAGLKVLDIGCGTGAFARSLIAEGAEVSGIDPGSEAIEKAIATVPNGHFTEAGAQALPYDDDTFHIAVMVFSLHHVPHKAMTAALSEALRVIRPDGDLVIMEPLASGSYFDALKPIEDETIVRGQAQQAIEAAIASGILARKHGFTFNRQERFADVNGFLDRVVSVDPARRAIIDQDKEAITANVLAVATQGDDNALILDLLIKVDVFQRP